MGLKIAEISFENLFKLISMEEQIQFELDNEYFQQTQLEIQDETNEWKSIKGLIKKQANSIELKINNSQKIICADSHLIQLESDNLIKASELKVSQKLKNTQNVENIITSITQLPKQLDVFDLEIDSGNHLYQCANGFIHHNTLLTAAIVKYANMLNMKTITIVPSSSLLKQTYDYIKQFEIPVGRYGNGKKENAKNIVATWQTLQNDKSFIRDFECIIWDECLHPSSKIKMFDDSEKTIETIKIGDLVKTLNEDSKEVEIKQVLNIHKNLKKSENQKMFKLTLEDDSVIELTGNHEVMTQFGWKRTDELTLEDDILCY